MPRRYKLAFGGDSGTGKTTLRECVVSTVAPPEPTSCAIDKEHEPTAICTWDLVFTHGTTFYAIDTPGAAAFVRHRPLFVEGLRALVVVYDITDRSSYKSVVDWIKPAVDSNSHVKILVVGNKSDLTNTRQISTDEALAKASELGVDFMETSARTGHNIKKMHNWIIAAMTGDSPSSTASSESASPMPSTPIGAKSLVPPWERDRMNQDADSKLRPAMATNSQGSTASSSDPYHCFSAMVEFPKMLFRTLSFSSSTTTTTTGAEAGTETGARQSVMVISSPPVAARSPFLMSSSSPFVSSASSSSSTSSTSMSSSLNGSPFSRRHTASLSSLSNSSSPFSHSLSASPPSENSLMSPRSRVQKDLHEFLEGIKEEDVSDEMGGLNDSGFA